MFNRTLGIILLIIGSLLLTFGFISADSIASSFSKFFTGNPTDKTVILLITGTVALGIGFWLTAMSRRA